MSQYWPVEVPDYDTYFKIRYNSIVPILTVEVPDYDTYFKIRYNTLSSSTNMRNVILSKGSHRIRVNKTGHVFTFLFSINSRANVGCLPYRSISRLLDFLGHWLFDVIALNFLASSLIVILYKQRVFLLKTGCKVNFFRNILFDTILSQILYMNLHH